MVGDTYALKGPWQVVGGGGWGVVISSKQGSMQLAPKIGFLEYFF